MKKATFLSAIISLISSSLLAQNTLPTTGNVGINNTTPNIKLAINANIVSPAIPNPIVSISDNSNGAVGLLMKNENTGSSAEFRVAIQDQSSNSLVLSLPSTGNTAASVFGIPRATGTFLFSNGSLRDFGIGSLGAKKLVLGTNNTARLTILSNGFVGIGTSAPSEELSVNGKIRAKEVKVEMINWPDFVFHKDYNLVPLNELADFIRQNHHLPQMPKAMDAETKGIELGEMNKLLLQKIEELTLYLIESDKKQKSQDIRLKKLEQRLLKKRKR